MRGSGFRLGGALLAGTLAALVCAASAHATFPGRNGEIVVGWDSPVWRGISSVSGIAARSPFGTGTRSIANCSWDSSHEDPQHHNCSMHDPAISPDGQTVAVLAGEEVTPGVDELVGYRMSIRSAATGEELRTFPLSRAAHDTAWSPAGDSLIATVYDGPHPTWWRDGTPRLVRLDLDGREIATVADGGALDADWSVRGDIAFVRDGQLWITRLGGPPRRITSRGGSAPSWSPDGRRLAFERDGAIWTALADGSRQRRIYRGSARLPVWSPDGRRVAFLARDARGDLEGIWTMYADGCRPRSVVPDPGGSFRQLSWRALPGEPARSKPSPCVRERKRQAKRRAAERQRRATVRGRRGR